MAIARTLTLADQLRRLRRAAGLSQEELAERAGLSRTGISELERGLKRAPHKDTVTRLANALQLDGAERIAFEVAARGRSRPADVRAASASPAALRSVAGQFVGRERELARLIRFLAGDGTPLMLLSGEPGIGKSRLLREAAARARDAGWTVLEAGCQRRSGQPPYAPLLEALAQHVASRAPAQLRADLDGASWLVRLLPELADTTIVPAPQWVLPPEHDRRLMFGAVARYLANVAGPAGTLLALDDLQWAGIDALDLLGFLVSLSRSPSGPPLVLLGTYRSTEVGTDHPLSHLLADLARDGLADDVSLGPLAPEEARSLLEGLLNGEDGTDRRTALIDRLLERAGGVPFYLVSCARAAQARDERAGQPKLESGADEEAVPWDAAQSIRQRLALLPAGAEALLGSAAVVGRQVGRPILEALAAWLNLEPRSAATMLAAAQHARLLLEDGDAAYRFAHDLIREVAAADLGAWRRRTAHGVIAEAMEAQLTEPERDVRAAELALQFVQSGAIERALPYLERAGELAQARYANADAEHIYRELLQHYEHLGRALDAARAGERLGQVLTTMAHFDEAVAVLKVSALTYQRFNNVDGYAQVMAAIGRVCATNGAADQGIEELELVRRAFDNDQPTRGEVAVYTVLALLYWTSARYSKQAAAAARAASVARTLGDNDEVIWANALHGMALSLLGRLEDGVALLEGVLPQLEQKGDIDHFGLIVNQLAEAYACQGKFDLSLRYSVRVRELSEVFGNPLAKSYACYWLGLHALYTGDWRKSRAAFDESYSFAAPIEMAELRGVAAGYPLLGLGQLVSAQGEHELGGRYLEEALAGARRGIPPRLLRPVQGCLAEADLFAGQPVAALSRLDSLVETQAGREGIDATPLLPLLAWAHLEAGNLQRAEEVTAEALSRCRSERHQVALLDALRVRALLAIRLERWDQAAAALDEAISLARTMPYPYAEAKALYVYGELEVTRGDSAAARERYEQAQAICQRLGEVPYRQRIEQSLAGL
ncbi:MAG TPA: AAA family ATPase [Ktedonobacterales bacterium]